MGSGTGFHLAQVNVARMREPLDRPSMRGFVDGLEPINALADASPGFVWRLQTDGGDATSLRVFDDEMMIVNLSVWASLPSLRAFVYASEHAGYLRRRSDWFERLAEAPTALWWIAEGDVPTVGEAKDRLATLRHRGPTPDAFTLRHAYEAPAVSGA